MRSIDMTVGNPTKNILLFSIPVLLGALFQQFYNITDTVIVGRFLGEQALAAVGSTGSMPFLVLGLTMGFTQGMGVLISNAFGARKPEFLRHLVALSMVLTVICSVTLSIPAVLLSRRILLLIDVPEDILDAANSYIRVIYSGVLFSMSYNTAVSILRAVGDSRTPLVFLMISSVLNICLDVLFITVFCLGPAGVAYATILSQAVSMTACFLYMFRSFEFLRVRRKDFYMDLQTVGQLIRMGIPMALNHSITAMGHMALQSGVNSFGPSVVAAYTSANKLETLFCQFNGALGTAMATYCGQNLGAGKLDRIYEGVRKALGLVAGIYVFGLALYFSAAPWLLKVFVKDPTAEMMEYAISYLHTSAWFLLPLALIFLYRNCILGLRNSFAPMAAGVVELICRGACIYFLLEPLGYWCIRLTNPIDWTVTCLFLAGAYYLWEYRSRKGLIALPKV